MKSIIYLFLLISTIVSGAQAQEASCLCDHSDFVYKILRMDEWHQLKNSGEFHGSPHDLRDGFIHLATADQVESIVAKYFNDEPLLYVVEFSTGSFDESDLRWEQSSSSKKLYPHLYNSFLYFGDVINYRTIKNH